MNRITSRDNSKLKHAKRVRDGKSYGEIFIEGIRLAEETLRSNVRISDVFVSSDFVRAPRGAVLIDSFQQNAVSINEVDEKLFQPVAATMGTQGIIVIGERPETSARSFSERFQKGAVPLTIFLSEINNPSNLGAIFRTAEAVGVSGVIVSNNSADAFSPKALRASMGAGLRLNIWENAAFEDTIHWSREHGFVLTAAHVGASKTYTELDWKIPRLLVMGSEAHGLSSAELSSIEERIRIPMENQVESLNLAVSCGVILYEAKRQVGN